MYNWASWLRPLDHPKLFLTSVFTIWKLVLLCVALTSPGLGYDTSTTFLNPDPGFTDLKPWSGWTLTSRLEKLVRWDAIYFTQIACRGYLWEQEWAFGWGFTKLLGIVAKGRSVS